MCKCDVCGRREAREAEAKSVLLTFLTPAQAQQLRTCGYFDVQVNGRLYRICGVGICGVRAYNVYLIEGGIPRWRFCAVPGECVPNHYVLLSQFLMLTTNEERFLRIANRTDAM